MENYIYYNNLYDFYAPLLTELQKEYFEYYYVNNLSFSEIAEIKNVSKAAVSQQISTIEKKLNEFENLFTQCDFLLGPVTPTPAFKIGENTQDPIKMYLADIMTVPASLVGLPAISVPAGESQNGLPIGVQIIGKMKSDAEIIALADSLENNK